MTYPTGPTPPNYPQYPQYPQYPSAPQYPQYPAYPSYPQYAPQYAPQWAPPVQPAPPPLRPLEQSPHGLAPDRYARIGAIVAVVVVVVAVVLATVAPLLVNHSSGAVPSNWAKIYDGQPNGGTGYWQLGDGCTSTSQGLHLVGPDAPVDTAAQCRFLPSESQDLTSQGFYFEAVSAPPADVATEEEPVLVFGNSGNALSLLFDQSGEFVACSDPCDTDNSTGYTLGIAGSWHPNGYTANTIAVLYSATSQQATVYANGQEVTTVAFSAPPNSHLLLSCGGSGEALFTHVRIFTGSHVG